MSRTLGAPLTSHLATGSTTLARCVRLDLRDGSVVATSDHDRNLTVNLGDGAQVYSASTGMQPGAISLKVGLDADVMEIRGPLSADVTRAAVLGGRFDLADIRVFDVNWKATGSIARLLKGWIAEAQVEGGEFVFEVRGLTDAFNQTIGRVLSPICSHDFGVGQCQATPQTWSGTITGGDDLALTVSWSGGAPTADLALAGQVAFTTGELAGCLPVEVFLLSGSTLTLFAPLAETPAIGDAFTLTEGCEKTRAACKAKGQILNMGGFPDVPGSDQYLKYPVPGE